MQLSCLVPNMQEIRGNRSKGRGRVNGNPILSLSIIAALNLLLLLLSKPYKFKLYRISFSKSFLPTTYAMSEGKKLPYGTFRFVHFFGHTDNKSIFSPSW